MRRNRNSLFNLKEKNQEVSLSNTKNPLKSLFAKALNLEVLVYVCFLCFNFSFLVVGVLHQTERGQCSGEVQPLHGVFNGTSTIWKRHEYVASDILHRMNVWGCAVWSLWVRATPPQRCNLHLMIKTTDRKTSCPLEMLSKPHSDLVQHLAPNYSVAVARSDWRRLWKQCVCFTVACSNQCFLSII